MRLLLADDHNLFRDGITSFLRSHNVEVIGEASDGLQALEKARELRPDIVIMDIKMPRCNGLEATRLIKSAIPDTKIIIVTVSDDESDLFEAIKSGAEGYLLKDIKGDEFLARLEGLSRGEAAISPIMAARIIEEFADQPARGKEAPLPRSELTDRETDVLRLVTEGSTNKEIATSLNVTENTVKYHLRNIMDKLHLRNRAAVAAYAASKGIKSNPPSER